MSDPDFQRAFAEMRDADRKQAPPFAAMRVRALAWAQAEVAPRRAWPSWRLAGLAAAALVIAVCSAVWTGIAGPSSAEQVEQLIAAIDAHLTARLALSDWESPTDFLLSQETSNPKDTGTP